MKCNRSRISLELATTLILLAGCGSKEPVKNSVSGRVFYRDSPLNGGAIVFVPDVDRGNTGPLAKATIREDGTFSVATSTPNLATGWYQIAVAPKPTETSSVPTASNPYPGPPSRYRNPQLSGLAGEVKPGIENVFEFQLED
jgi:hypothetical protein